MLCYTQDDANAEGMYYFFYQILNNFYLKFEFYIKNIDNEQKKNYINYFIII